MQLISTEVTRIQDCVQSTTRYHHIRDLVLENLNIICVHNTADGKDILKLITGWTKQFHTHDELHIPDIPQSWNYYLANTISFTLETTKHLQPYPTKDTIATFSNDLLLQDQYQPSSYSQALQKVTAQHNFEPIFHPKSQLHTNRVGPPAILVQEDDSYKRKKQHREQVPGTPDSHYRKCLGCGYDAPNQLMLESHCNVNASSLPCSSIGMCPIYQGRFGYASLLIQLDPTIHNNNLLHNLNVRQLQLSLIHI